MGASLPRSQFMRRSFMAVGLIFYTVGLCTLLGYLSFNYPIKTDRYRHSYWEHIADRWAAHTLLLRSNSRVKNTKMSIEDILAIVAAASTRNSVDPCLVHAVVLYESGLNPNTISTTGAMGLMALQPATAKQYLWMIPLIRTRTSTEGRAC